MSSGRSRVTNYASFKLVAVVHIGCGRQMIHASLPGVARVFVIVDDP
jgi:hypothetical protein